MELHSPGRVSDPESLRADRVFRQEHSARRDVERVAVPFEGVEALGQGAHHGVGCALGRELDLDPADLRARRGADVRSGRTGEQLAAEADAHERLTALDGVPQKVVLAGEPGVPVLLVHVHRAAEDDERVEALGRLGERAL